MVILLEPPETPYDLRFRLGSIPVRINPWFWVMGVVIFWDWVQLGFGYLALGVACLFVSILIHELGHILMGQAFGAGGHIVLYSFGGLAIGSRDVPHRWQRVAVSFGGPLAGFILVGCIWLLLLQGSLAEAREKSVPLDVAVDFLFYINLIWGLVNLLPIWPLDGGQISRELFEARDQRRGLRWSLGLSALLAGLIAVNALVTLLSKKPLIPYVGQYAGGIWSLILFAMLAFNSYQMLQQLNRAGYDGDRDDDYGSGGRQPWEQDPDYWKR